MGMLDLMYIQAAKIYDAPYQLKANNGIYLIDDFRPPADHAGRAAQPLDLSAGPGPGLPAVQHRQQRSAPFECFLVFSSNLNPNDLGDEAFLRRLEYKMYMANPTEDEFAAIFHAYCRRLKIECPVGLLADVIETHYRRTGRKFRRCHPRDVLNVAVDLLRFEKLPYALTKELLNRAFELKFVPMEPVEG